MSSLDRDIRASLETQIDEYIKAPGEWEFMFRALLKVQGIEANLETVLAFAIGLLMGRAIQQIGEKFHRRPTGEEGADLGQILRRRAFELRQSFLSTRIKE